MQVQQILAHINISTTDRQYWLFKKRFQIEVMITLHWRVASAAVFSNALNNTYFPCK